MAWFHKKGIKKGLQKVGSSMGLQDIAITQQQIVTELRKLRDICSRIEYQMPVAPGSLPIPPRELHALVSGNDELDMSAFFDVGRSCADSLVGVLKKHGVDIDEVGAILDFGCGCGRVIRYFSRLKRAKLYGTDYNPKMIEWCKKNLLFAEFDVNALNPPLVYGDGSFDVIYTFSVFTHLSETLQMAWLAELSRVLKPGGYLLLTTMGAPYADAFLPPRHREQFRLGQLIVLNEGSSGANNCSAFHPPRYVQQSLVKGFEIVEFAPGEGPGQTLALDSYLLRKL
jgi:SAM-dependent methyltransferase